MDDVLLTVLQERVAFRAIGAQSHGACGAASLNDHSLTSRLESR